MGVKIELYEGENINSAIFRFNAKLEKETARRWYKKRFGYYEKPSALKRKRKKHVYLAKRLLVLTQVGTYRANLQLKISQKELYSRTGPTNAAGR